MNSGDTEWSVEDQDQSISRTLLIDLPRQLYVVLLRTMNPQNVFICTANGSNFTKDIVFSEIFYTTKTYVKNTMSVTSLTRHSEKLNEIGCLYHT